MQQLLSCGFLKGDSAARLKGTFVLRSHLQKCAKVIFLFFFTDESLCLHFADYRQLVLLRQIKGSAPVTSSSTTVLLPQRLFSSVFTSRFFALSLCLAPCFLPLTPAFKAVVFFWFARGNNLGAPCFLRRTTALPANLQMEHSNLASCEMTMVNLSWITCDESVHMVMKRTNLLLALEWRDVLFNGRHQITCYFIFPFFCVFKAEHTLSLCFHSCYIKATARLFPQPLRLNTKSLNIQNELFICQ